MKIYVNLQEVTLFPGAKVKHALLKANPELYDLAVKGKAEVRDQEGNLVDLDGAVAAGWGYHVLVRG